MMNEARILYYTTSTEMVLKELRAEKGKKLGFKKSASQSFVNSDFEQKYKITLNMGRIESNPNFELKTLFYLCDYFDISVFDFFKRVLSKDEKKIKELSDNIFNTNNEDEIIDNEKNVNDDAIDDEAAIEVNEGSDSDNNKIYTKKKRT